MKDLAPESLRTRHTVNSLMVRPVHVPIVSRRTASGEVTKPPLVPSDIVLGCGLGHSMISTYTRAALEPTAELLSNSEPLPVGGRYRPGPRLGRWRGVKQRRGGRIPDVEGAIDSIRSARRS